MSSSTLQTKLYIPPVRREYIPRPRLNELLDAGLSSKLILLSAPAGYGKTSLLSEWASRLDLPCAWLSLDRYDNDLGRFLEYFHASIEKSGVEIKVPPYTQPQPQNGVDTSTLVTLINDFASLDPGLLLILDDFHRIQNEQVHSTVAYLLENLPPKVRLVITTRIDPPLRLAKLRARGRLCEIRADELRFTEGEAITFLNQTMKLGLRPSDITALTWKTEGWITGLQLAAISLKDNPDKGSFVAAFAGDDRHIADYLVDEALVRQSPDVQDFLLQTAILDRLCASLCDAITGNKDAREILSQLEQSNIFLIPLDNVREWYRYHHLFQDFLRNRLHINFSSDEIKRIHHKASNWFLSKDQIIDAIHHAFEADDMAKIVKLIETNIFTILDQGKIRTLQTWLATIPEDYKRTHPWLNIAQALVLVYAGELDLGESALSLAEETLEGVDEREANTVLAYILAIRAYSLWIKGGNEDSGELASQVLSLIPEGEFALRAFTNMVLGASFIQRHAFEEAKHALNTSIELAKKTRNDHIHILAASHLVFLLLNQAKFNEAEQICQSTIAQYENRKTQTSPAIAQIYALYSDIHNKRLHFEEALSFAQKGLEISKRWNQIDTETVCAIYLIETLLDQGDFDQARQLLNEVKGRTLDFSPWFEDIIEETEVTYLMKTGNFKDARQWAIKKGLDYCDPIQPSNQNSYINYARILLNEGKTSQALRLVDRLLDHSESANRKGVHLGLLPLKIVILVELGKQDQAVEALHQALSLAEPEGYKRGFIQYGESMIPLLRQVIKHGMHQEFAMELLASIEGQYVSTPKKLAYPIASKEIPDTSLLEPLSRREIEVLTWMAEGCTNQEIAQELVLSLHTVKSHARNIYGKLGVKNRTEAVARARLLGIID